MPDLDAIRERSLAKAPNLRHLGVPEPQPFDPVLLQEGAGLRFVCGKVDAREWAQVRRGWWIEAATLASLTDDQRHAALAHATARSTDRELVFSHVTAAVLWGLPVIGQGREKVHVAADGRLARLAGVVRHRPQVEPEPVQRHGLLVTSPARTVVDLACRDFYSGLAAADQALRLGLMSFDDLDEAVAAVPARAAGGHRARVTGALADPLAMSAGESYSRAKMFVHALPRPVLQVDLMDDDGFYGLGDFGWRGVVGEFDGRIKYKALPGQSPADAAARVYAEKVREDRIRRQQIQVARWVWADVHRGDGLLRSLRAVGIVPGDRSLWLPGGFAA